MSRIPIVLAMLFFLAAPEIAAACSVCFQANSDANRIAFLITTLLLTFMPLLLIGGLIGYVVHATRRREESPPA